jgi:hypothetical protein
VFGDIEDRFAAMLAEDVGPVEELPRPRLASVASVAHSAAEIGV